MASVWTATIQAFPESMRRSRGNVQRGNEGDSTYLTVTSAGAGVVCGYRPMQGAQSSVTYGPFVRAQDRLRFCGVTYSKQAALSNLVKIGHLVKTCQITVGFVYHRRRCVCLHYRPPQGRSQAGFSG